jgi:cell division protein FtsB
MRRDTKKIWLLRAVGAALLALTFGYLPYCLYARSGFSRYLQLHRELGTLRGENIHLVLEIARLQRETAALRSDPRVIEREARAQLNWVRPGEVVFDLPRDPQRVPDPPRWDSRPAPPQEAQSLPPGRGEAASVPTRAPREDQKVAEVPVVARRPGGRP